MQPPIRLRDYQSQCLTAIIRRYRAGTRRQLICLPTGTGKTVIFAQFPSFFRMKRRMLVLAHRAELLHQAQNKPLAANPALKVEIEQAGENASEDSSVVVASVPPPASAGPAG
jgi:ATP-dependent helicase IRC3